MDSHGDDHGVIFFCNALQLVRSSCKPSFKESQGATRLVLWHHCHSEQENDGNGKD